MITVHVPKGYLDGLNELVRNKRYPNRSEAVRIAIRDLLKQEVWDRQATVINLPDSKGETKSQKKIVY